MGVTTKNVLVTGSTSGIGLAIAKRMTAAGFNVAVNSFEPEASVCDVLKQVRAAANGEVIYCQADLAQKQGAALVENVIEQFGQLDILVNNAGIQKVSPVEAFPEEDWSRVLAVGLDASFETIRCALPGMMANGWGRIINISSAHGTRASPFKSAYVAAKHGVLGLTKTVALEVAEKGITVNAICPGYVLTPLVEKQLQDQAKVHGISVEEVKREIMLAPQPTKQFVTSEEVAELAFYLCGDMARSITGAAMAIDGGWTAK